MAQGLAFHLPFIIKVRANRDRAVRTMVAPVGIFKKYDINSPDMTANCE